MFTLEKTAIKGSAHLAGGIVWTRETVNNRHIMGLWFAPDTTPEQLAQLSVPPMQQTEKGYTLAFPVRVKGVSPLTAATRFQETMQSICCRQECISFSIGVLEVATNLDVLLELALSEKQLPSAWGVKEVLGLAPLDLDRIKAALKPAALLEGKASAAYARGQKAFAWWAMPHAKSPGRAHPIGICFSQETPPEKLEDIERRLTGATGFKSIDAGHVLALWVERESAAASIELLLGAVDAVAGCRRFIKRAVPRDGSVEDVREALGLEDGEATADLKKVISAVMERAHPSVFS